MLIVLLLFHHEPPFVFLMLRFGRLSTIILADRTFAGTHVSAALIGDIRTGGDRGLFEYATALINVNETAKSVAAGIELSRRQIILSEKERRAGRACGGAISAQLPLLIP
jgi:hypothetical protein